MTWIESRGFRLSFSAFALFTGLAGDSIRNLLTWWGYGAVVLLVVAGSLVLLISGRKRWTFTSLPLPLVAFMALATLSIAWSHYPLASLLGVTVQWFTTIAGLAVALTLDWRELLKVLGWVLRSILGLSYLFEFIVSAFIRHPVFPVWLTPEDPENPAKLLYWSRNLLFEGGKIQGIVGNSSLLAMIALVALIVFAIQLGSRSVGRVAGWFWVVVAVATIAITQSATILVGSAVVALVAAAALLIRRVTQRRALAYGGIAVALALVALLAIVFRGPLLSALGKSSTFTGRFDIWDRVIGLAEQRPTAGWGWISYWMPWVDPYDHLIVKGGVQVLHAHNAWLDVWVQLGVIGLIVFGALVISTLARSWLLAVDGLGVRPGRPELLAMLPLLVLAAQLVQSVAESRLLIEGGWMLLVIWAVKSKLPQSGVRTS